MKYFLRFLMLLRWKDHGELNPHDFDLNNLEKKMPLPSKSHEIDDAGLFFLSW